MPDAELCFLIPTRNRPLALARTLTRLAVAAGRIGAPILVCDQSAAPLAASGPWRILHQPHLSGLPAARNQLLAASPPAKVLCFLDDDLDVAGDFGLRLAELVRDEPDCAAWGPVVEVRSQAVRRLHRLVHHGVFRDPRRLLGHRLDRATQALFGCCFAVRRAAAEAAGGFDERLGAYALGEDLDFFLRLGAQGERMRFSAALRCIHRRDGGGRFDPLRRGRAKAGFLLRLARTHGGDNPATLLHLVLALAAAAAGRGQEPASAAGVLAGLLGR